MKAVLTVSRKSEIMCGMEYKVMGEASWQTRVFVEDIVKIMERKGMTRLGPRWGLTP